MYKCACAPDQKVEMGFVGLGEAAAPDHPWLCFTTWFTIQYLKLNPHQTLFAFQWFPRIWGSLLTWRWTTPHIGWRRHARTIPFSAATAVPPFMNQSPKATNEILGVACRVNAGVLLGCFSEWYMSPSVDKTCHPTPSSNAPPAKLGVLREYNLLCFGLVLSCKASAQVEESGYKGRGKEKNMYMHFFFKSKQQEEWTEAWGRVRNWIKFVYTSHTFSMPFAKNIGEVGALWFHSHLHISAGCRWGCFSSCKMSLEVIGWNFLLQSINKTYRELQSLYGLFVIWEKETEN